MSEEWNHNLAQVEDAAERLGPLMDELVLVGGCATGLLITEPGAAQVRATIDVDLVVEAVRYAEYAAFEEQLRARGFGQDSGDGNLICRWRLDALTIDVMPVGDFLGFSNRWYASAVASKKDAALPSGREIQHIDAPHFLATKLEAMSSRGGGDPVASHDAEDVVLVLDGRPSTIDELAIAPLDLQDHVARGIGDLLDDRLFMQAFDGYFDPSIATARAKLVESRMMKIAGRS